MTDETDVEARTRLGRGIVARLRSGGGPGRAGAPGIGTIALTSTRFALGTGRAPAVRRALSGAATARAGVGGLEVRPPRWWRPTPADEAPAPSSVRSAASAAAAGVPALAPRGLRRAVIARLHEPSAPGGTVNGLSPVPVPVRRPADVTAAGRC